MVSLSFSAIYMLIEEPGMYKPQHKPLYLLSFFVCVLKWYKIISTYLYLRELFVPDTDTIYIFYTSIRYSDFKGILCILMVEKQVDVNISHH